MHYFKLVALAISALFLASCSSGLVRSLGPVAEDQAVWKGPWKSTDFPGIHGTVITLLPDQLEAGKEIDVPVVSKSSYLSLWMPGETFAGRGRGVISEDGMAASTSQAGQLAPTEEKKLGLTQYVSDGDMVVKHIIQFDANMTTAEGFWVSNDGDKGTFKLRKIKPDQNTKGQSKKQVSPTK